MGKRPFSYLVAIAFFSLQGCVQTQYQAGELPGQFIAQPIRNYSNVDFTPFARPIANNDRVRDGDQLTVTLNTGTFDENSDLKWDVSVDDVGQAALPHVGPVELAGLTRTEAEKRIVQASMERDVFLTPTVEVRVQDRPARNVYVVGAVQKPGFVAIGEKTATLADVIVRAGGLTPEASGRISVSSTGSDNLPDNAIRSVSASEPTSRVTSVSLSESSPEQLAGMIVSDGAVVNVEETPLRPIQVLGVIQNQAVEVPAGENVRLLDALTLAGGQTYSNWISDRVTVIRRVPGRSETIRIKASIRGAKANDRENILLAPHDIVSVEENILTFTLSTLGGLFGAGVSAAQIGAF